MTEKKRQDQQPIPLELQQELNEEYFRIWLPEIKELLPTLDDVEVVFDNQFLIQGEGVGGFALARNKVALAFDPGFTDKERQIRSFKGTFFHEHYHTVQGFVGDNPNVDVSVLPAIEGAILEGAATVFERDKGGSDPFWGRYPDRDTTLKWVKEIKKLPADYDWQKWKWFHPQYNEANIMYRAGTFIVDEYLAKHPEKKIEDIVTTAASQILDGAGI